MQNHCSMMCGSVAVCQANCNHFFCGNCLQSLGMLDSMSPVQCHRCQSQITLLIPSPDLVMKHSDACEVLKLFNCINNFGNNASRFSPFRGGPSVDPNKTQVTGVVIEPPGPNVTHLGGGVMIEPPVPNETQVTGIVIVPPGPNNEPPKGPKQKRGDILCAKCFVRFNAQCIAECGHWFCGGCLTETWLETPSQLLACSDCRSLITHLTPSKKLENSTKSYDGQDKLKWDINSFNDFGAGVRLSGVVNDGTAREIDPTWLPFEEPRRADLLRMYSEQTGRTRPST